MVRLAIAALVCVIGCGRPVEAELIELRGAGPDRIAPGVRLRIEGRGLPIGREARVRLEGVLHRPGQGPHAVDAELDGTVVSPERIEVAMPEATLRRLGGRGTFRGVVEVSFGSGAVDGRVLGELHGVVIDLVPGQLLAIAPGFAEDVGLEIEPPDEGEGLAIASVAPGSPAERAGLVPGDRVLEIEGLRVLAPEELAAPPDVRVVSLAIAREGLPGSVTAALELGAAEEVVPLERVRIAQLAALALLLALLFLGPPSIAIDRLAPAPSSRAPIVIALATAVAAAALRAALDRAPSIGLDAPLAAAVAARGAITILAARGTRERLGALARALASAGAAAALLGAATIAIGTTAPAAVEAAQGAWPWEWSALRTPIGPLVLLLALAIAACGPRAPGTRLRALDDALLAPIAIVVTIAALGGASVVARIAELRPSLAALGYVPFAIVAAFLAVVLRRARDRASALPSLPVALTTLASAAITAIAAMAWLELDVPTYVEHAIGEVVAVTCALLALRIATSRPTPPPRPAHALL